jgi:hypothetical protein
MGWTPAITVLVLLNVGLLFAIGLAPLARRWHVRARRRHRTSTHQLRTINHEPPTTNHQPPTDLELCAMLTRLERRARNVLLASLDRRDRPASPEVLAMANDVGAPDRISAIRLLGTTNDPQARRTLTMLVGDSDPAIRRISASAAAWSARVGYPRALDAALVDRLLHALDHEPVQPVVTEIIDALTYSLDARVPAVFLRHIPSSRDEVRERLVESGALFAHLVHAVERRQAREGVAAR